MRVVLDTNVLLDDPHILSKYDNIILCSSVLEEIDKLKKNEYIGHIARTVSRKIEENIDKIQFVIKDVYHNIPQNWNPDLRDNKILLTAKEENATIVSNDLNVRLKAEALGIPYMKHESCVFNNSYTGFKIVDMDDGELALWYERDLKVNKWDLNINEYLLIRSESENKIVDSWVWTAKGFRHISTKKIDSVALGKISCKDEIQLCAIDSLCNNAITMIKGKAGTGKSILTAAYTMSMIESNKSKIDKLIIFTNPLATKGSAKLGFYPGTKDEKLLDSQVGHMLASKFGKVEALERLIQDEKLLLLPFSDIRGFDTTGMKALIWITEAQNLDIELMRLAIQRVGDDCQVVIDGDYEAQIDCGSFEGDKNGMIRVSEIFRGQDFYGEVELQKVHRSKWADWANKL